MIKPDMIPDEVVEAALKKRGLMREAIADALNAWPGMTYERLRFTGDIGLILPLPQEVSDE
jgi:hypothetical protein